MQPDRETEDTSHLESDPFFDNFLDDPSVDPSWFDLDPEIYYGISGNSCGFLPDAPSIVDEVDSHDFTKINLNDASSSFNVVERYVSSVDSTNRSLAKSFGSIIVGSCH